MKQYIKNIYQEWQRRRELNRKLEALTDNTLIYRMWASEHGTELDKAVIRFHEAVQEFNTTVDKFLGK